MGSMKHHERIDLCLPEGIRESDAGADCVEQLAHGLALCEQGGPHAVEHVAAGHDFFSQFLLTVELVHISDLNIKHNKYSFQNYGSCSRSDQNFLPEDFS